jgi:hypothetical protein
MSCYIEHGAIQKEEEEKKMKLKNHTMTYTYIVCLFANTHRNKIKKKRISLITAQK